MKPENVFDNYGDALAYQSRMGDRYEIMAWTNKQG